jgi:hypothetical protein
MVKNSIFMKKINNVTILIGLLISNSCSFPGTLNNSSSEKDSLIFNIGKDKTGSNFSVNINFRNSNFSTKANDNGIPPKTFNDVTKYQVYLIKNSVTSAYPSNGDPLSTPDLVAGPLEVTNAGAASKHITFANVQSSGASAYYAAVRAQDGNGNDLLKENNNWGPVTSSISNRLAISSGAGVIVNEYLQLSQAEPLAISAFLEDGQGAGIETVIAPNNGSGVLPAMTVF